MDILVSFQTSVAELENVKLKLVEVKDKYVKLSVDLADMKEVLGRFMVERSFIDRMSKASCAEVNYLFYFFQFFLFLNNNVKHLH